MAVANGSTVDGWSVQCGTTLMFHSDNAAVCVCYHIMCFNFCVVLYLRFFVGWKPSTKVYTCEILD